MRLDDMAVTVARQEHHFKTVDFTKGQRAGGFAIGGAHDFATNNMQVFKLGKPGPTNDGQHARLLVQA